MGKQFADRELTLGEYRRVEDAYVDAFAAFADDSGIDQVEVRALDAGDGLREGELLSVDDAREVVRRMLREEVICKLEAPDDRFAWHVGLDLYAYIGSDAPSTRAVEITRASGLYVDDNYPSPQLADEE